MGESERSFPLDFEPQCHQFRWMLSHLGGWQFGEQNLIPAILEAIGHDKTNEHCIEYGAGDGESLPLTIDRLYQAGRDCVLVERDDNRKVLLKSKYTNAAISDTFSWNNDVFTGYKPSVVVIDIDGRDSIVMREMLDSGCRPALLICEHMDRHYSIGTTLPSPIPEWLLGTQLMTHHRIQDTAETLQWIASKYGYERIGLNRCNSFFVRKDLFPLLFRG